MIERKQRERMTDGCLQFYRHEGHDSAARMHAMRMMCHVVHTLLQSIYIIAQAIAASGAGKGPI